MEQLLLDISDWQEECPGRAVPVRGAAGAGNLLARRLEVVVDSCLSGELDSEDQTRLEAHPGMKAHMDAVREKRGTTSVEGPAAQGQEEEPHPQ